MGRTVSISPPPDGPRMRRICLTRQKKKKTPSTFQHQDTPKQDRRKQPQRFDTIRHEADEVTLQAEEPQEGTGESETQSRNISRSTAIQSPLRNLRRGSYIPSPKSRLDECIAAKSSNSIYTKTQPSTAQHSRSGESMYSGCRGLSHRAIRCPTSGSLCYVQQGEHSEIVQLTHGYEKCRLERGTALCQRG